MTRSSWLFATFSLALICQIAFGQAKQSETSSQTQQSADAKNTEPETGTGEEAATIKGKIVLEDGFPIEFDVATLPVRILEQIAYEPPPLPNDWGTMTDEQRQAWIKDFQESDAGKKFIAGREERAKNQRRFDVKIDEDGAFEVFDVPPGNYNLFGRKDVELDSKKYAVEVYGQFEVADVDELKLQPLPVAATRLLTAGEAAPAIEVESLTQGGGKLSLDQFRSRPVLLHFWTTSNPAAERDAPVLKKVYESLHEELKLDILSICVDETSEPAEKFLAAQKLAWPQGKTNGWRHPVFASYGLRSIPAFWLLDAEAKVRVTNAEFFQAFMQPRFDMTKWVRAKITGVSEDTKAPTEAGNQ